MALNAVLGFVALGVLSFIAIETRDVDLDAVTKGSDAQQVASAPRVAPSD